MDNDHRNSTIGLARYTRLGTFLLLVITLVSCDLAGRGYESAAFLLAQSLKPGMADAEVLAAKQIVENELRSDAAPTYTNSNGIGNALPDFDRVFDIVAGYSFSDISLDCSRVDQCHPQDLLSRMSFAETGEARNGIQILIFESPDRMNNTNRIFYAVYSLDKKLIGFISQNHPIAVRTQFDQ